METIITGERLLGLVRWLVRRIFCRFIQLFLNTLQEIRFWIPIGPQVLLLNYTAGEENWGCKATSKGLLKLIEKAYPHARIRKRPIHFAKSPGEYQLPSSINEFDTYLSSRIHTSPEFKWFDWADVIMLNGEGSMHEWPNPNVRPEPYLRMLEVYAVSRFFPNKKIMTINQSVDYWSDEFAGWIKRAYQSCDYISVREPRSLGRLRRLDLKQTKLVPDAAFLTVSVPEQKACAFLTERGINEGYIAVFFGENVGRAGIDKLEDFLRGLQQRLDRQVVLFSAPYPDTAVVRELQSRLELPVIGLEAYPEMLVGILSRASLILSGRFHCCIFSALARTPFVPFRSNTDKIEGLVELLNYPVPVTVFEESSNEDVLDFVEGTWQKHSELSENLRHTVPQIVSAVRKGYQNVLKGQRI